MSRNDEIKNLFTDFNKQKKASMALKVKKAIALYNLELAVQQASNALICYIDKIKNAV